MHGDIIIIACPHGAGIIGRIACEPYVAVCGRGTCFSRDGHGTVKIHAGSGAGNHHVLHGVGEQISSGFLQHLPCFGISVIQNHISVRIQNTVVKLRLYIYSMVGNGCISCIQFIGCDPMGQTAQSQSLVYIGIDLVADLGAHGQCGKAKIDQIVISQLRSDSGQSFYCNNVQRLSDSLPDGLNPSVTGVVPVVDGSACVIVEGCVIIYGGQGLSRAVQGRGKGGQHLEGGSGRAGGGGGSVQSTTPLLCTAASHDSLYIAGFLVLYHKSDLGLRCHGDAFGIIVLCLCHIQLCHHGGTVGIRGLIGGILGGKDQIEISVLVGLKPGHHVFLAVIDLFTIGLYNGESVIQIPFYIFGEIVRIGDFLVSDGLYCGIQSGFDAKPSGGQKLFRRAVTISGHCHQILLYLLVQRIRKIGTGCSGGAASVINIMMSDTLIYGIGIGNGFVILGLGNKIQIQHFIKACFPPSSVIFREADGIIFVGILSNTCDDGAFGHGQIAGGLAEIALGSRFHSQGILAQIDGVHVLQKDLILGINLRNFQSQVLLLEFPLKLFDPVFSFGGPFGKNRVFQKLLGNGAGALRGIST